MAIMINPVLIGGGLKPIIRVTSSDSGAVLTVTATGVPTQTYTLGASETTHDFAAVLNKTYTVTATNGGISRSTTVSVTATQIYAVSVYIHYYLYNDGEEYSNITGGWSIGIYTLRDGLGTVTKGDDSVYFATGPSIMKDDCPLATNSTVNLTNYSKVCVSYKYATSSSGNTWPALYASVGSTRGLAGDAVTLYAYWDGTSSQIVEADISSLSGSFYVVVGIGTSDRVPVTSAYVDKVWLE